jgi:hypothetical protein
MPTFSRENHAISWYSAGDRGGDARSLISVLMNPYAHYIPTMQDQAAQLLDNILTPVPITLELRS